MYPVRKILILSANPHNTARLRLDEEVREIEEGLRRSRKRKYFTIKQKWAVRIRDLRRAMLDYEPQIVHFCGHGEAKGVIVENEDGNSRLVSPEALAELFQLFSNQVECVLLNACYSELQAHAINQYIPYVIGMSKVIHDKTAIEFAVGFYDALGSGKSFEQAFKFARNAIQLCNPHEHLTPKLLKRASDHSELTKQQDNDKFVTQYNSLAFTVDDSLTPLNEVSLSAKMYTVSNPSNFKEQESILNNQRTLLTQEKESAEKLGLQGAADAIEPDVSSIEEKLQTLQTRLLIMERGYEFWDRSKFETACEVYGLQERWESLGSLHDNGSFIPNKSVCMRIPQDAQKRLIAAIASGLFKTFGACETFKVKCEKFGDFITEDIVSYNTYLFGSPTDYSEELFLIAYWMLEDELEV
jgi:hypothetical protein